MSESKNLANFVKICQKSVFLSRSPVFVISSVFHQKRNLLEPIHYCSFSLIFFGLFSVMLSLCLAVTAPPHDAVIYLVAKTDVGCGWTPRLVATLLLALLALFASVPNIAGRDYSTPMTPLCVAR